MQKNTSDNYLSLQNLKEVHPILRRISLSGFNYPEQLSHPNSHFSSIPETMYPSALQTNMYHTTNGFCQNKSEIASQNFFSENNVNVMNRNHGGHLYCSTFDTRHYNQSSSTARFSSSPLIAQTTAGYLYHQSNNNNARFEHRQPFISSQPYSNTSIMNNNKQSNSHSHTYGNGDSFTCPKYVIYDYQTNSYKDVVFYSPNTPSLNSERMIKTNHLFQTQSSNNENIVNISSEKEASTNHLECQLNMTQQNLESKLFPGYVEEDLMYFLQSKSSNDVTDNNRADSQSMPSLHGDDSIQSDFDNSEDEKLHTVHGEQMLQELQNLSSIFTNVVNLPLSRNNNQIENSQNNLSRFKRTRIKERTTVWRIEKIIVKDNMVRIISDKVLHMKQRDFERFEELENEIFGFQISKQKFQTNLSECPDCIHSRYLKHSNRTNHKYKPTFKDHSQSDLKHSVNHQTLNGKFSRQSHRKSLLIPKRIPVVWNPIIPLVSPTIPHNTRKLFEPLNKNIGKNSRTKRRWSDCGVKLDNTTGSFSSRQHHLRHTGELNNPVEHDCTHDHVDNPLSFDVDELCEDSLDSHQHTSSNIESKLDKQLALLKNTVMSHIECNMSEIKLEIQCLREIQTNITKELIFYKTKVKVLEDSIRQNLPQDQWKVFGIYNGTNND